MRAPNYRMQPRLRDRDLRGVGPMSFLAAGGHIW